MKSFNNIGVNMGFFRKHDGTDLVPVMTDDRLKDLDHRDFSLDDIDVRRKAYKFREQKKARVELKNRLERETSAILKELGLTKMPTLEDIKRKNIEKKSKMSGKS